MFNVPLTDLIVLLVLILIVLAIILFRLISMIKGTVPPNKSYAISWLSAGGLGFAATAIMVYRGKFWVPQLLFSLILLGMGAFEWKRYKDTTQ